MKKYFWIFIITIAGLILRLIFINKPDGLWNDEYISWYISVLPFDSFWSGVKSQCHMPLYYIYLKFVIFMFGDNDLVLRTSSLIPGILSIPVMYLVGKEYNKETAYFCSIVTAISSFLIYFSQEVRFYSLLFLISAACLLYTIRLLKNTSVKNIICYTTSCLLIILTHTIGFVFVFFNMIYITSILFKKYKKEILTIWVAIFFIALSLTPLVLKIFTTQSFSQWWGHFSISKIGFLFTDYFSPVITNITNAPDKFFYMPNLAIFMIIPSLIAIMGIINSLKEKLNLKFFLISASYTIILIIAALIGKLVFLTKYSIEIYPTLILLACYGWSYLNNKKLKITFLCAYCIISLGYILIHPYSAPKMHRAEGHKIPIEMIKHADIKKNDYILIEYYPKDRFEKYFDFTDYNVISIHKGNFYYFMSPEISNTEAIKNGKELYKDIFKSDSNQYFENLLRKNITDNLQFGQSVVMIVLNSVSLYSPDKLGVILNNETLYSKTPFLFLVFSYIQKETFENLAKRLAVTHIEQKGKWTIIKFTKLYK